MLRWKRVICFRCAKAAALPESAMVGALPRSRTTSISRRGPGESTFDAIDFDDVDASACDLAHRE
jgi:hypothetical protein